MADCELLKGCLFFNDKMPMETGLGAVLKKNYCQSDNANCARHLVFQKKGKEAVPTNLYPNMQDRAREIISS